MDVTAPNQVWISDITYIRTIDGFCYLALITNMYSRKIVGYDISDSLELSGWYTTQTGASNIAATNMSMNLKNGILKSA